MPGRKFGRLRKGEEFDSVYAKGSVMNGPFLVVRCLPNGLGYSRWGFAVGKKLLPRASARNRVRRRLREAIHATNYGGASDCIVTAKAATVSATFAELVGALSAALDRLERQKAPK